ncbi:hypothetical protein G7B40_008590 [Aetokthonos hydrillicola Thurmond2011]|jgi:hypothetical protein|uniref:Uncharacterized protein n=1 Tax=Aetokthonos hydrillicola Thurmond2011 TaxID=2712845 RepID=A0AAP5I4Q7_9CYAN|nr:hypothetical protein [Aetokthonos hydrillicola]MDR9894625.1 hypothetical protein [Aetokthonos hydrillicola Thurmond2011]
MLTRNLAVELRALGITQPAPFGGIVKLRTCHQSAGVVGTELTLQRAGESFLLYSHFTQ